jgi:uncharacterized protein YbjT (DUF2867 family)
MRIVVTGVNGKIGSRLALRALEAGYEVVGASSHPEHVGARPYEVLPVRLDQPETLRAAISGCDATFLYPAAAAVDELVRELEKADLRHVVLMTSSSVLLPRAGLLAEEFRAVEQAVQASDLPWTLLRPDAFASNTLAWAQQVTALGSVSLPYPDAHVVPVDEDDIVDAAVAALTDERHVRRAYLLTGPESLTQRQQVELIGHGLGRDLGVVELTRNQWRTAVEDFMPAFVADALLDLWAESENTPQPTDHTVREVTGQRPRTFAQWVEEHLDAFGGS